MTTPPCSEAEALTGLQVLVVSDVPHMLVAVTGEADLATERELRARLRAALRRRPCSLTVDLSDLCFCDLRGLDALHDAVHAGSTAGIAVRLRGMSRQLSWLVGLCAPQDRRTAGPCPALLSASQRGAGRGPDG